MLLYDLRIETPKSILTSVLHYSKLESYLASEDRVFKLIQSLPAERAPAISSRNKKGGLASRLFCVLLCTLSLFYCQMLFAVLPEFHLRSMTSIKSFQFPSSRSIITTSLIIMGILREYIGNVKKL
jgi:hypothetical protein